MKIVPFTKMRNKTIELILVFILILFFVGVVNVFKQSPLKDENKQSISLQEQKLKANVISSKEIQKLALKEKSFEMKTKLSKT